MKLTKDRVLGVLCLAFAGFIYVESNNIMIRLAEFEKVGPRTFPRLAAVIFVVCGLALIIRKPAGESKPYMNKKQFLRALLMFACYVLYLALLYFVGLKFAAPIALFVMGMLFGKGKAAWWKVLIFSIVFGVAFYLLYAVVFQIRVPRGIL